jgi:hypothetical protein
LNVFFSLFVEQHDRERMGVHDLGRVQRRGEVRTRRSCADKLRVDEPV